MPRYGGRCCRVNQRLSQQPNMTRKFIFTTALTMVVSSCGGPVTTPSKIGIVRIFSKPFADDEIIEALSDALAN